MYKQPDASRRNFLKKLAGSALGSVALPSILQAHHHALSVPPRTFSANDQVNVAVIGMGIMGFSNARTTVTVPGVRLTGVCDLYTGRLQRAREVFGKDLYVTQNFQELLDRKDIDAVIVATSDHWHDHISIAAMNKGKHVYCEKPMVHQLEEGAAVIATQQKTGKVFQVGSQRVSSIVTDKARQLYASGVIGQLVLVETWMDRQGANGAWQYSIPTDAQAGTVAWDAFLGDAPRVAYDPVRFFRWRNYQDYGTGIAGDLFVHLFSALHTVIQSKGPERIYATGGLRYWKDGRDVPDIISALYDYPATDHHPPFTLQMRVNFVDGSGGGQGLRLVGTEGVMTLGWDEVSVKRHPGSDVPGYGGWDSFDTFSLAQQEAYKKWYAAHYSTPKPAMSEPERVYRAPENYNADFDHHVNFYASIREKAPLIEDAWFSMRAAGPALASNKSYFDKKIIRWDPELARVIPSS